MWAKFTCFFWFVPFVLFLPLHPNPKVSAFLGITEVIIVFGWRLGGFRTSSVELGGLRTDKRPVCTEVKMLLQDQTTGKLAL